MSEKSVFIRTISTFKYNNGKERKSMVFPKQINDKVGKIARLEVCEDEKKIVITFFDA